MAGCRSGQCAGHLENNTRESKREECNPASRLTLETFCCNIPLFSLSLILPPSLSLYTKRQHLHPVSATPRHSTSLNNQHNCSQDGLIHTQPQF